MAYIYKITNKLNGKIYIGKTEYTIEKRWKEHISKVDAYAGKRPLYSALKKYGIDNFSLEKIEECNSEEVDEKEKYWIEFYDSYENGYNATLGGEGVSLCNNNIIFALWNNNKTITEICKITGYGREAVSKALDKYNISIQERQQRGYNAQGKITAKLDKDTEEILEIFPSAEAAGRAIGKKASNINNVCNGKRKTAYGYKWKYLS